MRRSWLHRKVCVRREQRSRAVHTIRWTGNCSFKNKRIPPKNQSLTNDIRTKALYYDGARLPSFRSGILSTLASETIAHDRNLQIASQQHDLQNYQRVCIFLHKCEKTPIDVLIRPQHKAGLFRASTFSIACNTITQKERALPVPNTHDAASN